MLREYNYTTYLLLLYRANEMLVRDLRILQ